MTQNPTNVVGAYRSSADHITAVNRRFLALMTMMGISTEQLFDASEPHTENLAAARRLLGELDMMRRAIQEDSRLQRVAMQAEIDEVREQLRLAQGDDTDDTE